MYCIDIYEDSLKHVDSTDCTGIVLSWVDEGQLQLNELRGEQLVETENKV